MIIHVPLACLPGHLLNTTNNSTTKKPPHFPPGDTHPAPSPGYLTTSHKSNTGHVPRHRSTWSRYSGCIEDKTSTDVASCIYSRWHECDTMLAGFFTVRI